MNDLFGIEQLERAMTPKERRKLRGPVKKRGHAALPGTGPVGETCGTCEHLESKRMAKAYLKCGLMVNYWTGGPGTDVRAKDAACRRWEKP